MCGREKLRSSPASGDWDWVTRQSQRAQGEIRAVRLLDVSHTSVMSLQISAGGGRGSSSLVSSPFWCELAKKDSAAATSKVAAAFVVTRSTRRRSLFSA